MVLQSIVSNAYIVEHSNTDHSGMLHNIAEPHAEWCDIERLEQTTENLSNSLETFVEGLQVCF